MKYAAPILVFGMIGSALVALVLCPSLDLVASGLFYDNGFFLAQHPVFVFLHGLAVYGSWALGGVLVLITATAYIRRKDISPLPRKGWLFLLLALLIGPVLIANVGFKDHWGRARPREVTAFGGTATFSPALVPQAVATKNGSFISGDGAFGFYLPCFAYLVPLSRRNLSRRVFWGGMAAGGVFSFARLAMGAHFLSDILFAALLMLACSTALHTMLYGKQTTRAYWREWLGLTPPHR